MLAKLEWEQIGWVKKEQVAFRKWAVAIIIAPKLGLDDLGMLERKDGRKAQIFLKLIL